jgi:ATP diphosphatase
MKQQPEETSLLAQEFLRAVEIMARLRAPGGCPWDRAQSFASIRRHTIEEAYEVLDAIDREHWPDLQDELGDLLLQVLFYAEMAAEANHFTLGSVLENLNAKLIRRHPHVFGDADAAKTPEGALANWEAIKRAEKQAKSSAQSSAHAAPSMLDTVPQSLPALLEAEKLGKKAARVGFDWPSADAVLLKVDEELAELRDAITENDAAHIEEELGDLLFSVANLARKLKLTPEMALRASSRKFRSRFQQMEQSAAPGRPLESYASAELEALWVQAKRREARESLHKPSL